MNLEDLNPGDKVKIQLGNDIYKAVVIQNHTSSCKLHLKVKHFYFPFIHKRIVRGYWDYYFEVLECYTKNK